jgi:SAM-dependent methyltransferase
LKNGNNGSMPQELPRVRWCAPPKSTDKPCFVCENRGGNVVLLEALHFVRERGYVEFARCGACASVFCVDALDVNVSYPSSEKQLEDPAFVIHLHHYLEMLDGLPWKVPLLEQLRARRIDSVLEVGCNMGVTLDYCRTAWQADVVGLEPSAFGVGGARMLGLPILQKYLEEAEELRDRRFDLIFATEVLEHVNEPRGFLGSMRRHLTDDGYLFMTTPRAEMVTRETPPGVLYAILSAGSHNFLLSTPALSRLVAEQFGEQYVWPFGTSHLIVVSNGRIGLRDWQPPEAHLHRYYSERAQQDGAPPRVRLGFLAQAHEWALRTGAGDAEALAAEVEAGLRETFDLALDRPFLLAERLAAADTMAELGRWMPFTLPVYLKGRARQLRPHAPERAHELATLAVLVCLHGLRVDFQNFSLFADHYEELESDRQGFLPVEQQTAVARALVERIAALRRTIPELARGTDDATAHLPVREGLDRWLAKRAERPWNPPLAPEVQTRLTALLDGCAPARVLVFEPTLSGSRQAQLGTTATGASLVVAIDPFVALSAGDTERRVAELAALGDDVLVLRTGSDPEEPERLAAFAGHKLFRDTAVGADEPRVTLLRRGTGLAALVAGYEHIIHELYAKRGSLADRLQPLLRDLKRARARFVPADSFRGRVLDWSLAQIRAGVRKRMVQSR